MRGMASIIAMTAVLLTAQALQADEPAVEAPEGLRVPVALMSQVTKAVEKVDLAALAERKMAMFRGDRYYRSPRRETDGSAVVLTPRALIAKGDEETGFRMGWFGWTLAGVLVVGLIVAWRLGWFTPFSQRQGQDGAGRVPLPGSSHAGNRKTRRTGPHIELVKRGG